MKIDEQKSVMRTVFYYTVLVFESVLAVFGIRMYEQPSYQIIDRLDYGIEIRHYGSRLGAEVDQPRDGNAEAGKAFRLLFDYIAGANTTVEETSTKIAMTAAVVVYAPNKIATLGPMLRSETDEHSRMLFFMPSSLTQATAPKPIDPRVKLIMVPAETIAVLRFSGTYDSDATYETALMQALGTGSWQPVGEPYMLFYDPPFTIPMLRRNEAAVAVERRH